MTEQQGDERLVPCRQCGAAALEAWYDPAPGLCPGCLDDRLWHFTMRLLALCEQGPPDATTLDGSFNDLVGAGLRPAAAANAVARMAASLQLPCPPRASVAIDPAWEQAARVAAVRAGVESAV